MSRFSAEFFEATNQRSLGKFGTKARIRHQVSSLEIGSNLGLKLGGVSSYQAVPRRFPCFKIMVRVPLEWCNGYRKPSGWWEVTRDWRQLQHYTATR